MADSASPKGQIEFLQFHLPALKSGEYEVVVEQVVSSASGRIPAATFTTNTNKFSILGERFSIDPGQIHSVFPPAGSLGDHAGSLPHIILERSTLPWERESIPLTSREAQRLQSVKRKSRQQAALTQAEEDLVQKKASPWLALLLFYDDEKPTPKVLGINELNTKSISDKDATVPLCPKIVQSGDNTTYPEPFLILEPGQEDTDRVTVIDVRLGLLKGILPNKEDLKYIAHCRQSKSAPGTSSTEGEISVLVGNRLPKAGGLSTVHLVSIEKLYNNQGFVYESDADTKHVRLVSLKSWSFACIDQKQSFTNLLKHLNGYASEPGDQEIFSGAGGESYTLRLPESADPGVEKYYAMGYTPLAHQLRNGEKTVSWYHGPLVSGEPKVALELPAKAPDHLLIYNSTIGMLDAGYAAAWELGRLLALQSKKFSIALFNWKRTHAQQAHSTEQKLLHAHLPLIDGDSSTELPNEVTEWFKRVALLKGVPFDYLVPDEQMLPVESIRFFKLDPLWIECLLDGAFSIGRVTSADHSRDAAHIENPADNPHPVVSGFLLRSDVVSGWPSLLVDGYKELIDGNTFVPDKRLLFELDLKFEQILNDETASAELRTAFQASRQPLSDETRVIALDTASWLIVDDSTQLRYSVKKGSAKLEVYDEHALRLLRMDRLSANVLLCLFEGEVKTVDIHQKPETLHYGFEPDDFSKLPRNSSGDEALDDSNKIEASIWKHPNGRADLTALANTIKSKPLGFGTEFTSADFALAMIEGVQKVRFTKVA